ncbi:MAG: peptide-methionine (S)-S-oxide reductase MsrA [Anaerorhabdus sp.]
MEHVIYFAGGCFWGVEKFMSSLPGVVQATSGYANSILENPAYEQVKTGNTQARECVLVSYDSTKISLKTLVFSYFLIVDPTVENKQGHDIGSQYQAGIYFNNEKDLEVIQEVVEIEKERVDTFKVEIKALENFYEAEQYHQKYLDKNPQGYCHVPFEMMKKARELKIDAGKYQKPSAEIAANKIAQHKMRLNKDVASEHDGVYVDVVTGEPLFEGIDIVCETKDEIFFQKPIDGFVVIDKAGDLFSRVGNIFLGKMSQYQDIEVYKISKEAVVNQVN